MKEVYIVTHTQATHHVDGLVGGWFDSELTAKGLHDAKACGRRLHELQLDGVPIYSSDLARTRQTAHEIAQCLGSPIEWDDRLREMSFGEAGGLSQEDVGGSILSSDGDNRLDFRNVYNGETKRELASRLYDAMHELIQEERAIVMHAWLCDHVPYRLLDWYAD